MTTHTTSPSGHDGLGLITLPSRMLRGYLARAAERRALAALRRLDDRLLRDVGLTRGDVHEMTIGL